MNQFWFAYVWIVMACQTYRYNLFIEILHVNSRLRSPASHYSSAAKMCRFSTFESVPIRRFWLETRICSSMQTFMHSPFASTVFSIIWIDSSSQTNSFYRPSYQKLHKMLKQNFIKMIHTSEIFCGFRSTRGLARNVCTIDAKLCRLFCSLQIW